MQDLEKLWHQVRSMLVLILLLTAVAITLTVFIMNKKSPVISQEIQTETPSKTLSL